MRKLVASIALVWLLGAAQPGRTQDYPVRPVMMIVPHAPGGGVDIIARIVAERMRETLGQPVVVENVPAAAGAVGVERAARAVPDGYTIATGDQTSFVISSLTNSVRYDVLKDFEPVALLSTSPSALVARTELPSSLADLIAGRLDLQFVEVAGMLAHLRGNKLKVYAVLSDRRSPAAREVPTIEEAGGPRLHLTTWRAVWAPKGMPRDVIARINRAVAAALDEPDLQRRAADLGQEIVPRDQRTPQALAAHHRAEMKAWLPMIQAASIRPD